MGGGLVGHGLRVRGGDGRKDQRAAAAQLGHRRTDVHARGLCVRALGGGGLRRSELQVPGGHGGHTGFAL